MTYVETEGYEAFKAFMDEGENPYKYGRQSEQWYEWSNGWNKGYEEWMNSEPPYLDEELDEYGLPYRHVVDDEDY